MGLGEGGWRGWPRALGTLPGAVKKREGLPSPALCPQLVLAEGAHSDAGSQGTDCHTDLPPPLERTGGIGDSRPPSFQ